MLAISVYVFQISHEIGQNYSKKNKNPHKVVNFQTDGVPNIKSL